MQAVSREGTEPVPEERRIVKPLESKCKLEVPQGGVKSEL